jgi:hypothetical protein
MSHFLPCRLDHLAAHNSQRREPSQNRRCRIGRRDSAGIRPFPSPFSVSAETFPRCYDREIPAQLRHFRAQAAGARLIQKVVGGPSRNRTGVHGFAVRYVTTPPSGRRAEEARRNSAAGFAQRVLGAVCPIQLASSKRRVRWAVSAEISRTVRRSPGRAAGAGTRATTGRSHSWIRAPLSPVSVATAAKSCPS